MSYFGREAIHSSNSSESLSSPMIFMGSAPETGLGVAARSVLSSSLTYVSSVKLTSGRLAGSSPASSQRFTARKVTVPVSVEMSVPLL